MTRRKRSVKDVSVCCAVICVGTSLRMIREKYVARGIREPECYELRNELGTRKRRLQNTRMTKERYVRTENTRMIQDREQYGKEKVTNQR